MCSMKIFNLFCLDTGSSWSIADNSIPLNRPAPRSRSLSCWCVTKGGCIRWWWSYSTAPPPEGLYSFRRSKGLMEIERSFLLRRILLTNQLFTVSSILKPSLLWSWQSNASACWRKSVMSTFLLNTGHLVCSRVCTGWRAGAGSGYMLTASAGLGEKAYI